MISIRQKIRNVRKTILDVSFAHHLGHVGCAISIANVLTVLYSHVLKISPKDRQSPKRDRFILSKGHAAVALYAVLYHEGFVSEKVLNDLNTDGALLGEHNDYNLDLGIEYSAGSLGHGLSVGCGMALGLKHTYAKDGNVPNVYVLVSDAELNEGSTWEAIMYTPHKGINNLCLIIDDNNSQGMGKAITIINLQPLRVKLASFGWYAVKVDSHNYLKMKTILQKAGELGKPIAVIIKSRLGDGVSFMENDFRWHYLNLDEKQYKLAVKENSTY